MNQGYQPTASLLFDWSLPADWMLELNVGFAGDPSLNNSFANLEATSEWSLQHEVFEDFDIFFHGYFNGSSVPRFGDGVMLGGGAVWAVTQRFALFGSYNGGVSDEAPTTLVQIGGALAF